MALLRKATEAKRPAVLFTKTCEAWLKNFQLIPRSAEQLNNFSVNSMKFELILSYHIIALKYRKPKHCAYLADVN